MSSVIVPVDVIVSPVKPSPAVSEVIPPPTLGAQLADVAKLDEIATEDVVA